MNKKDFLLIGSILLFAGGIFLFNFFQNRNEEVTVAEVTIRGQLRYTFSLYEDGIFTLNYAPITIEIRDRMVAIIKADCPDELCLAFGFINHVGQSAICLPNQTVLSVAGGENLVDIFLN